MNLYNDLNTLSRRNDWPALELHFYQLAVRYAGVKLARLIQSTNLEDYTMSLHHLLNEECLRLSHHAVKALYFEYDLDNSWDSHLFLCDRYSRSTYGNDEWACHWIDKVVGPDLHEFARLYKQYGGFHAEKDNEIAVTFYLMARTIAAYGKAVINVPTHKKAVCIGHHDQDKITRVFE